MIAEAPVGLIISIAFIVILVLFLAMLLIPAHSREGKIAKSYMNKLKDKLSLADSGKDATLVVLDDGTFDSTFFLVYFGDALNFKGDLASTIKKGDSLPSKLVSLKSLNFTQARAFGKNVICSCYYKEDKVRCPYCENLKSKAICKDGAFSKNTPSGGSPIVQWVIQEGARVKIIKSGGKYVFSEF